MDVEMDEEIAEVVARNRIGYIWFGTHLHAKKMPKIKALKNDTCIVGLVTSLGIFYVSSNKIPTVVIVFTKISFT